MSAAQSTPGTTTVETTAAMAPTPENSTPEPPCSGPTAEVGRHASTRPEAATNTGVAGAAADVPEGGLAGPSTGAGALRAVLAAMGRQIMDNAIVILLTGVVVAVMSFGFDSLGDRIDDTNASINARIDDTNASINARIDDTNASINARIDDTNASIDDTNAKIDAKIDDTNARIDDTNASINAKIDDTNASINAKIDDTNASINARIDDINARIDDTNASINAKIDELGRAIAENGQRLARIEGFLGIGMPDEAARRAPGAALDAEPDPVPERSAQSAG